jgi:hypothetical protein
MKNGILSGLLIFVITGMLSCGSDDPVLNGKGSSYSKEDFYGIWKRDGSESSGCFEVIKIDATYVYLGIICGNDTTFVPGHTYTFSNNTFTFVETGAGTWKYLISDRTNTTFKAQVSFDILSPKERTFTKL